MKSKIKQFFAFILLFALIFSISASASPSSAASTPLGIEYENCTLRTTSNGVSFTINAPGANIYWPIGSKDIYTDANTVAIALSNYSLCTLLDIELIYEDGSSSFDKIKVEEYSTMKTYTLPANRCEDLAGIKINFGGISSGEIIVYFISGVSFFNDKVETIGEISVCTENEGVLTFKGTLRHDSVIRHKDSCINIYALDPGQSLDDIISGNIEPIMQNGAISIRFEFSVDTHSDTAGLKKYVAAAVDETGIEFIDVPCYPDVTVPQSPIAFKGIESSMVFGTTETGAGLSILEIDPESLFSNGNNGYMYTFDGESYFFDRNYISTLDDKIRVLSSASSDVYLRLLDIVPFYDQKPQKELYSMVRFLSARYSSVGEHGKITGVILGDGINEKIPAGMALSDYIEASYDMLYTVYAASNDAKNPIDAVIPVSEAWGSAPTNSSVASDLYLEAFFDLCAFYSENRFYIMAEANSNPYSLNDEYIDKLGNIDEADHATKIKKADPDCSYISSENIARLYRAFEDIAERYLGDVPKLIYAWTPDENTSGTALTAAYVYNYYKLFFSRYISSFVVCIDGNDAAQDKAVNELKYKMKYIDTSKSLEVGDFAREVFGIDSWKSEILSFKESTLATRVIKDEGELIVGHPDDIIGTYAYWNFKTQSGYKGWQQGIGISSVYLENNAVGGRAINATVDPKSITGEYAFFSYSYEYEENFRYNDYLLLDLMINSISGGNFEVNIMLGSKSFVYEYKSSDIAAGNKYTLALDIKELTEKDPVEYIRICVKDLAPDNNKYTVSLYSVSAASRTLENEALRESILEERDRIHGEADSSLNDGNEIFWIFIVAAAIFITLIVMIVIARYKKNAQSEDRASE